MRKTLFVVAFCAAFALMSVGNAQAGGFFDSIKQCWNLGTEFKQAKGRYEEYVAANIGIVTMFRNALERSNNNPNKGEAGGIFLLEVGLQCGLIYGGDVCMRVMANHDTLLESAQNVYKRAQAAGCAD